MPEQQLSQILIGIGSGIVGGLAVAIASHFLDKDRHHSRERAAEQAAAKERRLQFVGFLRAWRKEFDRKIMQIGGYSRDAGAFNHAIPTLIQEAEILRADLFGSEEKRFSELVSAISARDGGHFDNAERYDALLKDFDALVELLSPSK